MKTETRSLIFKTCLFITSLIVSCVSIILIANNINNYFDSEEEAKQLLTEKIELEQQQRQAKIQARKQQEESKKHAAELAMENQKIKLKAKSLSQSGKLLEARTFLMNYRGKFALDTHGMRFNLAEQYYRKYTQNIAKKQRVAMDSILKFLLKKEYAVAAKTLKDYPAPIPEKLKIPIQELRNVNKYIAKTFKNDIGGLIMIKMKNGDIMSAKLTGIKGSSLQVLYAKKHILVDISDIAYQERKNRINFLSSDSKAIYLGIEAWDNKNKQLTGKFFRQVSEPLSQGLINLTGTRQNNENEVASRIDFFRILRDTSLITDDLDENYITNQLKFRAVIPEYNRKLKSKLDKFKQKYSKTIFIQKQAAIITKIYEYLNEKVDFLKYKPAKNEKRKKYSLNLSGDPPEAFWDVPPAKSKRYYAKLKIGKYNSINIVLDRGIKNYARITIDNDVDFTDKKPLLINNWTPIILLIKYDNCKPRRYSVEFQYSKSSKQLIYRTGCQRTGRIKIGEKLYKVSIIDNDADADYSKLYYTNVIIKAMTSKFRPIKTDSNNVFYIEKKAYKIESIKPDGSHIVFIPAKE